MTEPSSDETLVNTNRESAVAFVAQVVTAVLGFGTLVLLARFLGANGLGRYAFLLAISYLLVFCPRGLGEALRKRLSEPDPETGQLLGVALAAHGLYTGLVATVAFSTLHPAVSSLAPYEALAIVLLVATVGGFELAKGANTGLGRAGESYWFDTLQQGLQLAVQVPLLILGIGSTGLLLAYAGSAAAVGVALFARIGIRPSRSGPDAYEQIRAFAAWSIPSRGVATLFDRSEYLILAVLVSTAAVGHLEAAVKLALPALLFSKSVASTFAVRASQLHSRELAVGDDAVDAFRYAGLFAIPLAAGAPVVGGDILALLFGPDFRGATTILALVALQAVIRSFRLPLEASLDGVNRPDARFQVLAVTLPLKLILLSWGAVADGAPGALAGAVLAEGILLAGYTHTLRSEVGPQPFSPTIAAQVLAAAGMGFVLYAVAPSVTSTMIEVLLGAAVYACLLAALSPQARGDAVHAIRTISR